MNKLEKLQAAIRTLPDEFVVVRNRLKFLLDAADIGEMRAYSLGLYDVAVQLTSDEALMKPLREIREVLD